MSGPSGGRRRGGAPNRYEAGDTVQVKDATGRVHKGRVLRVDPGANNHYYVRFDRDRYAWMVDLGAATMRASRVEPNKSRLRGVA